MVSSQETNNKKVDTINFTVDLSDNSITENSGKSKSRKISAAKGFNLPGINIKPSKPAKAQTSADLFSLNAEDGSFDITSTVFASEDKKIFRARVSKTPLVATITNNSQQTVTFRLTKLAKNKNKQVSQDIIIAASGTGDISINQAANYQLDLLRSNTESFDVEFNVKISIQDQVVNDLADLEGTTLNLTGTFDGFKNPESITLTTEEGNLEIAVDKVAGDFKIQSVRRGKRKIPVSVDDLDRNIYRLKKSGTYNIRLVPETASSDYEVDIEIIGLE